MMIGKRIGWLNLCKAMGALRSQSISEVISRHPSQWLARPCHLKEKGLDLVNRLHSRTIAYRSKVRSHRHFGSKVEIMAPVDTSKQLSALRNLMRSSDINIKAYIVPSGDAHQSEYIADVDARRAFISGFDGSAGLAVITLDKAALFTDGRYYLQAGQQLDSNWTLMKQGEPSTPTWQEFIATHIKEGRIGVDPQLTSIQEFNDLQAKLESLKSSAQIFPVEGNLVDKVWPDQPKRPANALKALGTEYAGTPFTEKLAELRRQLGKHYGLLVTALDEVAWLFNLRGSDIDYNPVFFSYAIITHSSTTLYVDPTQVDDSIKKHLGSEVTLAPYTQLFSDLGPHRPAIEQVGRKLLVSKSASLAIQLGVGKANLEVGDSPITMMKAIKCETELEGFRRCHVRDGIALVKYFSWLEAALTAPDYSGITEAEAADKLLEFRLQQKNIVGASFATISSTGPNGAIIHYHPRHGVCDVINPKLMYLCDSGGQYLDGTTDVTRTWHFGEPTDFEKEAFTRVLQGVITLETLTFPSGTTGYHLDSVTRAPLWRAGLDFKHGVGHGVGSYLNVHEGPHGIGFRIAYNSVPLKKGMTVTNEPGYYEDGKFGIRIENILLVKDAPSSLKTFGNIPYLAFQNVTMVPIHTRLIKKDILSKFEVDYLNSYHQIVFNTLSPHLADDASTLEWLKRQTLPI
ncbi:hypothetical protein DSO57_1014149 [Entomophthora muscae]|uniref:Uncharacterized protein n=1 Tax=Entomophthora muscae TaxID=34485 RepID=A0ACC2RWM3_9FUNG|nr:hypothetical protein DSO57_1014149 [Entomophthora muscae]